MNIKSINTLRLLSVDMIENAKSGHPGMPLGCSPMMYLLFKNFMDFHPSDTTWINRDRFILSNGHGCALLYSILHLYKYNISMDDLKQIISPNLRLRICKGIYLEGEKIAFQNGNQINENYIALCQTLLEGEGFAEIATHDAQLIHHLDRWISENHIPMDRFEFQVLYGVPMGNTLEKLKDKGYRVRVYIPFGDKWYEYSIRRLKENPNIAGYVLKNMFKRK